MTVIVPPQLPEEHLGPGPARLGDEWPFTVDSGVVACDGDGVTFTADGITYAVNGTARGREMGIDVQAIWADNPSVPGLKKDISPVINRGLELCQ